MASEDEDDLPRDRGDWTPRVLDDLSLDQLNDYIAVLEGEIARVKAEIDQKSGAMQAADAFFKK